MSDWDSEFGDNAIFGEKKRNFIDSSSIKDH